MNKDRQDKVFITILQSGVGAHPIRMLLRVPKGLQDVSRTSASGPEIDRMPCIVIGPHAKGIAVRAKRARCRTGPAGTFPEAASLVKAKALHTHSTHDATLHSTHLVVRTCTVHSTQYAVRSMQSSVQYAICCIHSIHYTRLATYITPYILSAQASKYRIHSGALITNRGEKLKAQGVPL